MSKVATVESNHAALKESINSLYFVNAERDIYQVIDGLNASSLEEMHKSGRVQKFQTLSSLLSDRYFKNDQEKRLLDEEIVAALSSLGCIARSKRQTTGRHCPQLNGDEISSSILI
jgi:hypothetical protein